MTEKREPRRIETAPSKAKVQHEYPELYDWTVRVLRNHAMRQEQDAA